MIVDCSILITCKDKEEFLDECISSVARQTKEPKEIILVHDQCEEPKAHALADTVILRDHVGVAKARDVAFKASTGKLILFLDADDVISPDYLEKMILTIASGADVVYPDTFFWHENPANSTIYISPDVIDAKFVNEHAKTTLPVTCLMKRGVYETVGGFKEFPILEDLEFFLQAMCNDYTFKKAQTLLWYRQIQSTRNGVDERIKAKVKKDILSKFKITDKEVSHA